MSNYQVVFSDASQKKMILGKSVHPVHLWFLFFIINKLGGDYLRGDYSPVFTIG